MKIYLHESLYDLSKSGHAARRARSNAAAAGFLRTGRGQRSAEANQEGLLGGSAGSSEAGGQRPNAKYYRREPDGRHPDGSMKYRYFGTAEEYKQHLESEKKKKHKEAGDEPQEGASARLKDKLTSGQKKTDRRDGPKRESKNTSTLFGGKKHE